MTGHRGDVDDICFYGERLAAAARQFTCQFLETLDAARAEHNGCALHGEKPGGCLAQSAARSRDHDDFSFDVVVHNLDSYLRVCIKIQFPNTPTSALRCRVRHSPGDVPSQRWKARKKELASS